MSFEKFARWTLREDQGVPLRMCVYRRCRRWPKLSSPKAALRIGIQQNNASMTHALGVFRSIYPEKSLTHW